MTEKALLIKDPLADLSDFRGRLRRRRVSVLLRKLFSVAVFVWLIIAFIIFVSVPNVKAQDPTFGYETSTGAIAGGTGNIILGSVFTCPEAGTADSMTAYIQRYANDVGDKFKFGIYNHSDLSLVGTTEEYSAPDTEYAVFWLTLNFSEPKPSLTADTEYILVGWSELGGYYMIYYDPGDTNQTHKQTKEYAANFPDPLVPNHGNNKYSIYCTYTVDIPTVTVSIIKPVGIVYTTLTIPVQIMATGGTIDKIWYNCKNGTAWVYGSNQTYTTPTSMTGFINGAYTFYGWANNTDGNSDEETVGFSVAIPPEEWPATGNTLLWQYLYSGNLVGFIFACYTSSLGQTFYVLLAMLFTAPLYIRIRNLTVLGVAWMLIGGVFITAMPIVSPMAILLMLFGVSAVLYKAFQHPT